MENNKDNNKVWVSTEVTANQYALFIEVANQHNMSAKAFLRYVIKEIGKDAEGIRQGDYKHEGTNIQ